MPSLDALASELDARVVGGLIMPYAVFDEAERLNVRCRRRQDASSVWLIAFALPELAMLINPYRVRMDEPGGFYAVPAGHDWLSPAAGQPGVRGPYATLTGAVTVARLALED